MNQNTISFQQIYDEYAKDVYRFSYWLSGDVAEAKDMTSEAFVRAWTATLEIRHESVKAYLFAIARNQYLQNKRNKKKFTAIDEAMQDTSFQPDKAAEARSDLEETLKAMQTLSEIDRTVLIMRAQDEFSYEEIARSTGLSVSAVRVKVFRVESRFRESCKRHAGLVSEQHSTRTPKRGCGEIAGENTKVIESTFIRDGVRNIMLSRSVLLCLHRRKILLAICTSARERNDLWRVRRRSLGSVCRHETENERPLSMRPRSRKNAKQKNKQSFSVHSQAAGKTINGEFYEIVHFSFHRRHNLDHDCNRGGAVTIQHSVDSVEAGGADVQIKRQPG